MEETVLKSFPSLQSAKKRIIIQVTALGAGLLILGFALWLSGHRRFILDLPLGETVKGLKNSDVVIDWEEEEIPVESYEVRYIMTMQKSLTVISISMLPEKAGEYRMTVKDTHGQFLAGDLIEIGRFQSAFSWETGSFTGSEFILFFVLLFVTGVFIIMLTGFLKLRGPLENSNEAIFTCGVMIFSGLFLCFAFPYYYRHLSNQYSYPVWLLVLDFAQAGKKFFAASRPGLFLFSLSLIVSNIALLRHERPRFQNLLGILLGLILIGAGAGTYAASRFLYRYDLSYDAMRVITMIRNTVGLAFTYVECILLGTIICGLRAAKHVPVPDRDYILILGCCFRKDGTLTPLLKARVDKALDFWRMQKEKTGKAAFIIPSGGQGRNETMPEAKAMSNYIAGTDIPAAYVLPEDQSVNTFQNMQFSKDIIDGKNPDSSAAKVCYVTTNYHVLRSGILANKVKLAAEGLGAKTKWWFWPNAFVRECAAFFSNRNMMILYLSILLAAAVITLQVTSVMY